MSSIIKSFFVLAFNNTTVNAPNNQINNTNNRVLRSSHTKCFLPRVNITNYNVLIDGKSFYDQSINDLVKQTECFLDYHTSKLITI